VAYDRCCFMLVVNKTTVVVGAELVFSSVTVISSAKCWADGKFVVMHLQDEPAADMQGRASTGRDVDVGSYDDLVLELFG
jgi:hypothetical protein